jgi:tetratricopeptide (TPR) repeat protein
MHKLNAALPILFVAVACAVLITLHAPPAQAEDMCDMAKLTQAIHDRPKDAFAYSMRGYCLMRPRANGERALIKNIEAGIKDLERALQFDPRNYIALHNLGHAAGLLMYEDLAIYEFTQAIAVNPKAGESYAGRGWAYFESCKLKEASADFQRAASLDASTRSRIASSERMAIKQADCARPPPVPEYMRIGPQADPYFDHSSDYWRQRRWEERPH